MGMPLSAPVDHVCHLPPTPLVSRDSSLSTLLRPRPSAGGAADRGGGADGGFLRAFLEAGEGGGGSAAVAAGASRLTARPAVLVGVLVDCARWQMKLLLASGAALQRRHNITQYNTTQHRNAQSNNCRVAHHCESLVYS